MSDFPDIPYTKGLRNIYRTAFAGVNHRENATDGEIYDMSNLSCDNFPVMSVRQKRKNLFNISPDNVDAVYSYLNKMYYITSNSTLNERKLWEYKDGQNIFVSDLSVDYIGKKPSICGYGNSIIIFPDKIKVNITDNTVIDMAIDVTSAVKIYRNKYSEYYGANIENGCLGFEGNVTGLDNFKEGDAVKFTFTDYIYNNNKTGVIRKIEEKQETPSAEKETFLFFDENLFSLPPRRYEYDVKDYIDCDNVDFIITVPSGEDKYFNLVFDETIFPDGQHKLEPNWYIEMEMETYPYTYKKIHVREHGHIPILARAELMDSPLHDKTYRLDFNEYYDDVYNEQSLTIEKNIPDMSYIFSSNNRLWGYKDNSIFGSALGDPTNFYLFDGLSTDSYSVDTNNAGKITGAIAYNGYPTFFKKDRIYKLYGDTPNNFQLVESIQDGVLPGCEDSLCIANGMLYYISLDGVMMYNGGVPWCISNNLGNIIEKGMTAFKDDKLYLSAKIKGSDTTKLYVFDTLNKNWYIEDNLDVIGRCIYDDSLVLVTKKSEVNTDTFTFYMLNPDYQYGTLEDNVDWFCEFADMTFSSADVKGIAKVKIRSSIPNDNVSSCSVYLMYDYSDVWEKIGDLTQGNKHSDVLQVVPKRCDNFKIKLVGHGACNIYGLTVQYYYGSYKL